MIEVLCPVGVFRFDARDGCLDVVDFAVDLAAGWLLSLSFADQFS